MARHTCATAVRKACRVKSVSLTVIVNYVLYTYLKKSLKIKFEAHITFSGNKVNLVLHASTADRILN